MIKGKMYDLPAKILQHIGNFQEATELIADKPEQGILMRLQDVPLDRPANVIASALLARKDPAYFLLNKLSTKNLSLLGPTQILYYNNPDIEKFVSDINPNLTCERIPIEDLNKQDLAIHSGDDWSSSSLIRLSTEEFVPATSHGIYVILCDKDQLKLRKFVGQFHDDDCYDCSNVERSIQQRMLKMNEIEWFTCFVDKDERANIHGTIAYSLGGELRYVTLSQSTTYGFVDVVIDKLH